MFNATSVSSSRFSVMFIQNMTTAITSGSYGRYPYICCIWYHEPCIRYHCSWHNYNHTNKNTFIYKFVILSFSIIFSYFYSFNMTRKWCDNIEAFKSYSSHKLILPVTATKTIAYILHASHQVSCCYVILIFNFFAL